MSEDEQFLELSREDLDLICELPVCGCGCPETVYALYHRMLQTTPPPATNHWPTWPERLAAANEDETLWYVLAYVLDHIEASEHGTSVAGAWLTEKGMRLLRILDRLAESDYEASPCHVPAASQEPTQ